MNPLYLLIDHAGGYIEEKGVNKYLVFDSKDENKELLKKYDDVFSGIRNKKLNSDDDLPLNKQLKFDNMIITIRPVFEEDDKLYPEVFLDDTLYELNI